MYQPIKCRCADTQLLIALDSRDFSLLPLGVIDIPILYRTLWPQLEVDTKSKAQAEGIAAAHLKGVKFGRPKCSVKDNIRDYTTEQIFVSGRIQNGSVQNDDVHTKRFGKIFPFWIRPDTKIYSVV